MNYAGDISPTHCARTLSSQDDALIIDVRTQAEWAYVGVPVLPDMERQFIGQQWQVFPDMQIDADFTGKLADKLKAAGRGTETHLYFLCRSGVRSLAAAQAMTAEGYTNCYNISGGFEGDKDAGGHRGNVNGWKAEGLPWKQT